SMHGEVAWSRRSTARSVAPGPQSSTRALDGGATPSAGEYVSWLVVAAVTVRATPSSAISTTSPTAKKVDALVMLSVVVVPLAAWLLRTGTCMSWASWLASV